MTLDLPRRFPWPALLSIGIHGAVVMGLLYTSVHQVVQLPAPAEPISITLVAPTDLEPQPQAAEPEPEPVVEPEPIPEPKDVPVVIPTPESKPKPKPKPKPVKKEKRPKPVPQTEPRSASPFENSTLVHQATNRSAPAAPVAVQPSGPRALSRNQPQYPSRAYALRLEGNVHVRFDVASDGSVENVQILSAKPANMFERDVKNAMRRWRYEPGKPGKGLVINIVFRINGGAKLE